MTDIFAYRSHIIHGDTLYIPSFFTADLPSGIVATMRTAEAPPLAPEELQGKELQEGHRLALEIIRREAAATHSVHDHIAHLRNELLTLREQPLKTEPSGAEGRAEVERTPQVREVAHALLTLHIEEEEAGLRAEPTPEDVELLRERVRTGMTRTVMKAA